MATTPVAPQAPAINFPKVDANSVKGFASAWDYNGIKIILDNATVKFAEDFANQCLKSYVVDLMNKAVKVRQQKIDALKTSGAIPADAPVAPQPVFSESTPAPAKSSIILTD